MSSTFDPYYERVFEEFKLYHPVTAERVVSWKPSGPDQIILTLDDGSEREFDFVSRTCRGVFKCYDEDGKFNSDNFRNEFSKRLRLKMRDRGLTQGAIAEKSELSQVMISRYIHGTSLPTAEAAVRLARALKCSVSDLIEFD